MLMEDGLASRTATPELRQTALNTLRIILPKQKLRELLGSSAPALEGLVELMVGGREHGQEVAAYVMWDLLCGSPAGSQQQDPPLPVPTDQVLPPPSSSSLLASLAVSSSSKVCPLLPLPFSSSSPYSFPPSLPFH